MKAIYNKIFAGAIAICSVIACQVEDIPSDESTEFTFYAEGAENETKTIRQDDGAVWWDANENIRIFCNGISGKFTSDNKEPSATATFTGSFEAPVTLKDITEKGIMALYPYQEDAIYEDGTLTFSLPSEQVATKGTFGRDLFPCIASSTDTNLSFYNVCSGIKFSVVNDDIRSVTFKTSEEEPIAGLIEVDYFWNDMPSVTVKEGVSEVTVYAPDNGYFEPGEFYYITILPPPAPTYYFWDGFTMIYNKDGVSDSITINENVPLPRSKFGVIEGKDAGLLFIDYNKSIEFADPIMKEMCVNAFDTNGDGELSYKEAAAVTDLSEMVLTKKTINSFNEFQYFVSVRLIPSNYFENTNLRSIVLPSDLTKVGSSSFQNCAVLSNVKLSDHLQEICDEAFSGCLSLTIVDLPESVTKIGTRAFEDCSNLKEINIPKGITTLSSVIFGDCSNLAEITLPDGLKTIESSVFSGCNSLQKIIIPDTVTSIGSGAFNNCSNLQNIIIPEDITIIESQTFANCSNLTDIILPDGLTRIESWAFSCCSSLNNVNIPNVITIGSQAFEYCRSLDNVILSDDLMSIGSGAFSSCDLKDINIPESVTNIEGSVFSDCSSLTSINIPDGVTSIGSYTFSGCSSLASIVLPESVASIGDSCFQGCSSLTSINIPEGITQLGRSVFDSCSSLTSINIPDGVNSIGDWCFYKCSSLSSINIPEGVTSIGKIAFYKCSRLTSINIPEGVTSIGDECFYNCSSLSSIILPQTIANIGDGAFRSCGDLLSVYVRPILPPTLMDNDNSYYHFKWNASDRKIYVPHESLEAYKTAEGWSEYADAIVGYDFENDKVVE